MEERADGKRAQVGIRRAGDACFHPVEEEVPEGFICDGILIRREDVVEVTEVVEGERCRRAVWVMKQGNE